VSKERKLHRGVGISSPWRGECWLPRSPSARFPAPAGQNTPAVVTAMRGRQAAGPVDADEKIALIHGAAKTSTYRTGRLHGGRSAARIPRFAWRTDLPEC